MVPKHLDPTRVQESNAEQGCYLTKLQVHSHSKLIFVSIFLLGKMVVKNVLPSDKESTKHFIYESKHNRKMKDP